MDILSTPETCRPHSSNFWGRFRVIQLGFLCPYHVFSTLNHLKTHREMEVGGDYFNDLMFGDDEKEEEWWPSVIESVLQRGILTSA